MTNYPDCNETPFTKHCVHAGRGVAISYEIRDLKISISECGTVAWYYCVLDDINEWKGRPAEWKDTRWTGVLEK